MYSRFLAVLLPLILFSAASGSVRAAVEAPQLLVKFASRGASGISAETALSRIVGSPAEPTNASLQELAGHPSRTSFLITSRLAPHVRGLLAPDSPEEELHSWLVLRYPTVQAAKQALQRMRSHPEIFVAVDQDYVDSAFSVAPTDPLYSYDGDVVGTTVPGTSSAAAHSLLGLPAAWDNTPGIAYVADLDNGIQAPIASGTVIVHPDLAGNVRLQFSKSTDGGGSVIDETPIHGLYRGHGTHTAGIIAAQPNNGQGTSGGCWNCSLMILRITDPKDDGFTCASVVDAMNEAINSGAQIFNMSFGVEAVCTDYTLVDAAVNLASSRQVSITNASGNTGQQLHYPASNPYVMSVTATDAAGNFESYSVGGKVDFAAPGDKVFSTFYQGNFWANALAGPGTSCQSQASPDDAYGYCTGTSMAAPMLAAGIGVLRSANPLLTDAQVKSALAGHASRYGYPVSEVGSGVPNIGASVADTIAADNGVSPLFIVYSSVSNDRFYTSVPQMAVAAILGTLKNGSSGYEPGTEPYSAPPAADGSLVAGFSLPGLNGASANAYAAVNVFTTIARNGQSLVPLYRLSYSDGAGAVSHAYSADFGEISSWQSVGFVLDGMEGYIYPSAISQPPGTVKLYRRYKPSVDNYALFPESQLATFNTAGYTQAVLGADWIGYVCPYGGTQGVCRNTADVALSESVSPNPAITGEDVVFTMIATNNGPQQATGVTVTAAYDSSAAVVWASPGCTQSSGTYVCNIGNLAAGTSRQFRLVLRKNAVGSTYNNIGLNSTSLDPNTSNNAPTLNVNVNQSASPVTTVLYRLSSSSGDHVYTTDSNEYSALVSAGWTSEGNVGSILSAPGTWHGVAGTPFYRMYSTSATAHLWTADPNEYYTLTDKASPTDAVAWQGEGIIGLILPTFVDSTTEPLYRLSNGTLHLLTPDVNEYDVLSAPGGGWTAEGIAGYTILP